MLSLPEQKSMHLLFSGLAEHELILLCLIVAGGFVVITLGVAYLAGFLAKKHGELYEKDDPVNGSKETHD